MSFTIRQITPEDQAEWIRMRNLLWPGTPEDHNKETAAFFSQEGFYGASTVFLVFDETGSSIGFLELNIRSVVDGATSPNIPYVEGWYVDERVRGKGVGKLLIETAENWSKTAGYAELASDAEIENNASIQAHKALGFNEVERKVCFVKRL